MTQETLAILRAEILDLKQRLKSAEFWSKIVFPEGASAEDIQNELHDYYTFMSESAKVYDHATGGMISKTNTCASSVIAVIDDYVQDRIDEAIEEYKTDHQL